MQLAIAMVVWYTHHVVISGRHRPTTISEEEDQEVEDCRVQVRFSELPIIPLCSHVLVLLLFSTNLSAISLLISLLFHIHSTGNLLT